MLQSMGSVAQSWTRLKRLSSSILYLCIKFTESNFYVQGHVPGLSDLSLSGVSMLTYLILTLPVDSAVLPHFMIEIP